MGISGNWGAHPNHPIACEPCWDGLATERLHLPIRREEQAQVSVLLFVHQSLGSSSCRMGGMGQGTWLRETLGGLVLTQPQMLFLHSGTVWQPRG